jgi:hypothetical protein
LNMIKAFLSSADNKTESFLYQNCNTILNVSLFKSGEIKLFKTITFGLLYPGLAKSRN